MDTNERQSAHGRLIAWALILALAATLLQTRDMLARYWVNTGYVQLNQAQASGESGWFDSALATFSKVNPNSMAGQRAWRGRSLAYWFQSRPDEAIAIWEAVPGINTEIQLWAQQAERARDFAAARDWYQAAVRIDPDNGDNWYRLAQASARMGDAGAAGSYYLRALSSPARAEFGRSNILTRLGKRCQFDWNRDTACVQFLAQNGGNRFVNPDFAVADLDGWQQIDAPAHYSTVSCPDTPATACALIQVNADSSMPPAGLGQCFQVEAGTTYLFAVWLKVMTSSNGTWRPLYFQGIIDGQARGNWQENEQGSSDWGYWERTFVAQSFDDGQACFHPIRLQGGGQAWFYGAKVIALAENP